MQLQNKICVVTGAAQGIGFAIAKTFAEQGATVYAGDLNLEATTKAYADYPNVIPTKLDVTNDNDIAQLVTTLTNAGNKLDVLVNNAGITKDNMIAKMSQLDWDLVIGVNLTAVYKITKALLPLMVENGKGSIINMSSIVGTDGNIGQSNYAASKGGVIAMSKGWSKEFSHKGMQIRVNCVAPGFIKTPMTIDLPEKVLDYMVGKTLLKRMGEAQDIANGVLFLASDASSYITGQTLKIDGGLVL